MIYIHFPLSMFIKYFSQLLICSGSSQIVASLKNPVQLGCNILIHQHSTEVSLCSHLVTSQIAVVVLLAHLMQMMQ